MSGALFDSIRDDYISTSTWLPEPPPSLNGINTIQLNFETSGVRWWEKDRPIALAIGYGDKIQYCPWAHQGPGNLDEDVMKEWAQRELRGKHIENFNTRFEVHMARVWGVDLEAQGNTVTDVGHYAALLDDHRLRNNLDVLVQDYLGEQPMTRLDESRMAEYEAGQAAPRAMYNVEVVRRLREKMWPLLDEQNLQTVRALEDKVIYATVEMEKNGAPIDVELLDRWLVESQKKWEDYLWQVAKELGWQCNPDSPKDMERAFKQLQLPIEKTAIRINDEGKPTGGRSSFTDAILKSHDHPTLKLMRRANQLASLRSKFLVNTKNAMGADGILRYSLHQVRAAKDEMADAGEAGTITGRYSSSSITQGVGVNIQQRMKAARQRVAFGYDEEDATHDDEIFLVRKLHIAGSGLLLSSDMDQAQYRIFAHYVNNPRVIQAYRENPKLSFHRFMHSLLKDYASLTYRQQKDLNFAVIFGAGMTKMALMLGHITVAEFDMIRRTKAFDHPKLAATKEVQRIYNREIPEVQDLLAEAGHLGKPECDQRCRPNDRLHRRLSHRGYVMDYLGRRMRFPDGQRLHKAFNGVDQGTEAEYMKTKLVELHEMRKETGLTLRITNHDEVVGDIPDVHHAQKVDEILNRQSFNLRVPLTWDTSVGRSWAETESINE